MATAKPTFVAFTILLHIGCASSGPTSESPDTKPASESAKATKPRTNPELEEQNARRAGLRWNYYELDEEMGRGKIKTAVVRSLNQLQFSFPYSESQRATLRLRKHPRWGNEVMLSIEHGQFLCGLDGCRVAVRFGEGKPMNFSASGPSDHSSTMLFLTGYHRFVSNLRKVETVSIEALFYQEGYQVMTFDVRGLEWE